MLYYNLVPSYTSPMQIALMKAKKKKKHEHYRHHKSRLYGI